MLFYTILSAQAGAQRQQRNDDLQAEVDRLEEQVLEGYQNLVELRNSLESTDEAVPAEGLAARIIEEKERLINGLCKDRPLPAIVHENLRKQLIQRDLKNFQENQEVVESTGCTRYLTRLLVTPPTAA